MAIQIIVIDIDQKKDAMMKTPIWKSFNNLDR